MALDEISVFVAVVQTASFTKAANVLGMTKSTVSLKIANLEERLRTALLHRTTRSLRLTDEGEAFFNICSQALSEIENAEANATKGHSLPQGLLRVSVPTAFGIHLFPRFIAAFSARYPDIKVKIIVTNRFVDFAEDGVDVAIRAGVLKDSNLMIKRIGTSHFSLYASAKYLKEHGEPKTPQDLLKHRCLSFSPIGGEWKLMKKDKVMAINIVDQIVVDDITLLKELAVNSCGIALITEFAAREELAKKTLLPVLPNWYAHATGIFVVTPPLRYQHHRVRVFVDDVAEAFEQEFHFNG